MKTAAGKWKWIVVSALIVGIIAAVSIFDVQTLLKKTLASINAMGPWGPVLFVIVYALAAVLFIPGSVLTLGAGAVFGVLKGFAIVSIASTVGATAAFLVGRYIARDWVANKIQGNSKFDAIDRAVAREGWKIVGLTRLSPVFPFTLLNYAFGLTQVSLRHYILASWIGMIPGTIMYVYLGSLANVTVGTGSRTPGEWALYGIGLGATIAVTIFVTRIAKKALAERISS